MNSYSAPWNDVYPKNVNRFSPCLPNLTTAAGKFSHTAMQGAGTSLHREPNKSKKRVAIFGQAPVSPYT